MFLDMFKIMIVAFIYGIILIFIGPLIDHAFTDLHREESNWEIFFEIIIHIITIAIIWYYLNNTILEQDLTDGMKLSFPNKINITVSIDRIKTNEK